MRLVLASAALAAALFANIPASQAQSGNRPWCAMVNTGLDNISEICDFDSVEQCQPFVIAGNRGFCTENPRYTAKPAKRHIRRRARAH